MRIGIDCRTILNPKHGERAGVGHYTYYLVTQLLAQDKVNQYVLFFDHRMGQTKEFQKPNVTIRRLPFAQYKKFLPFTYSHMLISSFIQREKLDVYHSPANVIPYLYRGASVVTVHDLAIYRHPEWFPKRQKFSISVLVPRSLRHASRIIAVSEATKKDIVKTFRTSADKIKVVYEGVNKETAHLTADGIAHKYGLRLPYVLYVGTIEPRKNVELMVRAFLKLRAKKPALKKYQLVLAGHRGWRSHNVFKAIEEGIQLGAVRYLNYVPHEDKVALVKNATTFVFPSLFEGFGLPVLEAMAMGTPVITSKTSSLPEVTGSSALLVNPSSEKEFIDALSKMLGSPVLRRKLSEAGKSRATQFTWRKCAQATMKVYKEVAGVKK